MITKRQSKYLQGIAIILMMYHHFFSFPETVMFGYSNIDITRTAAWFAKLCVGLFSFVSGYGVFTALAAVRENADEKVLLLQYKASFVRLFKLFCKYWVIVSVYALICIFAYRENVSLNDYLGNMFLTDLSFNGSWWFMREYLIFLLISPLVEGFLSGIHENRKKRVIYIIILGIVGVLFVGAKLAIPESKAFFDVIQPTFILVFISGCICKKYELFEYANKLIPDKKVLRIIIGMVLIGVMVIFRVATAKDASFARYDFIIAPVFSLGALLFLEQTKFIAKFFNQFGRCSTYMWLTHVLIYDRTIDWYLGKYSSPIGFFMMELVIVFILSWCMQKCVILLFGGKNK